MTTRTATERTVTTDAAMLRTLIRAFIGDPYTLLTPRPEGQGRWGAANDQGMPIIDESAAAVAFIPWEVLREIVTAPDTAASEYLDRIEKRHVYAAAKALAGR